MTTPKQRLQAALDAITYNASVNRSFANGEFISIKADLDAVMEYLEAQDESYFDDGATFEEFPAAEVLEEETPSPNALVSPAVGTFVYYTSDSVCIQWSDTTGVWMSSIPATRAAHQMAVKLPANCGVELTYDAQGWVDSIAELPF